MALHDLFSSFPLTSVASEPFIHSASDSVPPESNLPPQIPASSLMFKLHDLPGTRSSWKGPCDERKKETVEGWGLNWEKEGLSWYICKQGSGVVG